MKKKFNKKLILFDLDGVLIDSKKNMQISWLQVQKKFDLDVSFENYFRFVGEPFQKILKKNGINSKNKQIETLYRQTSAKFSKKIKFFKGVETSLARLKKKKLKMGIVTSKDVYRTNAIISELIKFDVVSPHEKRFRGKPSPDQLLYSMAKCNCDPKETIYIGDAKVDMMAAKRAKIDFIKASWGYGKFEHKYSIDTFADLEKIII